MKRTIKEWIRLHPIEAFFLIGIAFSFGTLFPALVIIPLDTSLGQIVSYYLGRIGVYGPVLTAMLIARMIQPKREKVSLLQRLLVFLPAWLIAIGILNESLRLALGPEASPILLICLSMPAALLPALVITSAFAGSEGVKQMLATLVRPKGNFIFYMVAVLTFPVMHILSTVITNVSKGNAWFPQVDQGGELAYTVLVTFFSVLLFSGGINEEGGWRGFAQKRLQTKYSPLVANLILWFMMVIWHIPNDLVQYRDGGYLLIRLGLGPSICILFGWVFNRTRGSIWAPAIFHASMNAMNPLVGILPGSAAGNILLVSFAMVVVIADRMWRRLPENHPAVYQAERLAIAKESVTRHTRAVGVG